MKRFSLTHKTIGELGNGYAGKQIDEALNRIIDDAYDRGHDLQPRTVNITVVLKKVGKGEYQAYTTVETKVPKRHCPETNSRILERKSDGQMVLAFQPDNAENADQPSFFDDEEAEAEHEVE